MEIERKSRGAESTEHDSDESRMPSTKGFPSTGRATAPLLTRQDLFSKTLGTIVGTAHAPAKRTRPMNRIPNPNLGDRGRLLEPDPPVSQRLRTQWPAGCSIILHGRPV